MAIVNITINPINDVPIAVDLNERADEQTIKNITLDGTDKDLPDGEELGYKIITLPEFGELSDDDGEIDRANIDSPHDVQGSLTYISEKESADVLVDSFTFKANDGFSDSSNTATVKIFIDPVNDPPEASDQNVTVDEQVQTDITLSASDEDDTEFTYIITEGPQVGFLKDGNDIINEDDYSVTGALTYTSNLQIGGSDSFKFKANDGDADSNVATVGITINNVNANVDLGNIADGVGVTIDSINENEQLGYLSLIHI